MTVINTNVLSLNAQRNLNTSQSALAQSLQRLSSGLRINSAKDDAAGLAISERFGTQIRGINQAIRNANDGISFAQTAEGALNEITNITQRIRELAIQSINDSNSASDRAALNNEVQQSLREINRIANTTQFNGANVLDGSLQTLIFQVGANAGQTIGVDGVDSRGASLGAVVTQTSGVGDTAVDQVPGGAAVLDFGNVDFEAGNVTGTLNIDGRALALDVDASGLANSQERLEAVTNAITQAIANDSALNADDFEVTFNATAQTVSITNLSTESVNVNADLRTGDGAQIATLDVNTAAATAQTDTVTFAAVNITAGAFQNDADNAAADAAVTNFVVTLDGRQADLTSVVGGDYADTSALATALQAAIRDEFSDVDGIANFTVSANNDELTFSNSTLSEFVLNDLTVVSEGGSGTGTDSLSVTVDAAAAQSTTVTVNGVADGSLNFDISTGATGQISIDGVGVFDFSVGAGSSMNDLAAAVQAAIREAGNENVDVAAAGDDLVFTNNSVQAFAADLINLEDGQNAALFDDTLAGAEIVTLLDRFASGQPVNFDVEINGEAFAVTANDMNELVAAINRRTPDTGVRANLNPTGDDILLSTDRGEEISFSLSTPDLLDGDGNARLEIDGLQATVADNTRTLNSLSVSTRDAANEAVVILDFALDQISGLRGELGAVQNRFESAVANLEVSSENLSAARSRIRDADFAAETAELTRVQILQQAGLSVLAQANAQPQSVLALLQ